MNSPLVTRWFAGFAVAVVMLVPMAAGAVTDIGAASQANQVPAAFQVQSTPAPAPATPPAAPAAQPARVPATDTERTGAQSPPSTTGAQSAAQPSGSREGGFLQNPLRFDTLEELLLGVLQAVVRIGSIVLTLAIIWIGFLFVRAQGNDAKLIEARRALMWTVIGGLILLGAAAIGEAIRATIDGILR